ncbi:Hypothetical protein bglu_2g05790 [Burkholderia glumae BGR1]|nr:Hypothetical protein bglu_2g05790 [Burkholderia glumae BGR1]
MSVWLRAARRPARPRAGRAANPQRVVCEAGRQMSKTRHAVDQRRHAAARECRHRVTGRWHRRSCRCSCRCS